jgi:hypothetical protein
LGKDSRAEIRKAKTQLKENVKSAQWWKQVTTISTVIAGYFISSITLTFFQKRVIAVRFQYMG